MSALTSTIRRAGTFVGGLHPPERKGLAADAPIEVLPTPKGVRIALQQHLGAPCESVVKPRQTVAVGDVIGQTEAFVSAPVHSSVAGATVRASVATLPNGRHVSVIPIKADEEQPLEDRALFDDIFGGPWPLDDAAQYEPKQIADAARKAGLVGLGGAAFPTHVKLLRNPDKPVDTLLINGCECEPYLTADYRLMLEAAEALVAGTKLAQHACGAVQALICIEDNKPEAIRVLRDAAEGTGIEVRVLHTKYPQGGERQLVVAATGRTVPGGGLPLDVGVVVMNVGTAAALARAVFRGKPLTHRVVTVSGSGIREPSNVLTPVGASYEELLRFCGGLTDDAARVVAGGPMMGFTITATGGEPELIPTPVTKGTSGITVLNHRDVAKAEETSCVRCGRCVDVCPMRLVPTRLALAARAANTNLLGLYHISSCVECGCCAYACPASIPLVQLIRVGKLMNQKK